MNFKIYASHNDCTDSYYVDLDRPYTVGEFIDTIFKKRPNEWGNIKIRCVSTCSYKQGKVTSNEFTQGILSASIKNVEAHGGWSRMDYTISI